MKEKTRIIRRFLAGVFKASEKREPSMPAGRRCVHVFLKIFFLYLPAFLASLLALSLVAVRLCLTPRAVERIAVAGFRAATHGNMSLEVKSFNPFRGFDIRNIVIRNGAEFGRSTFVQVERLTLRYAFFAFFTGDIRFDEVGIYRPRVYLVEKGGVWNFSRLMKPPAAGPAPGVEPEKAPLPDEVRLPIPVRLLFRFMLEDFRLHVKGATFASSVEGVSFAMSANVPPVRRIPLSPRALALIESLRIELNPREQMDLSFHSRDMEVSPPLVFNWRLLFDKKSTPVFSSRLKLGTYRTPVRFKQAHLAPLHFMLSYDMRYDPGADYLSIAHLGVRFLGRRWLFLEGSVSAVSTRPEVDLRVTESIIFLDDLYPYFKAITGDNSTRFGGRVSLMPMVVRGNETRLEVHGGVDVKNLYYKSPSFESSTPSASLVYHAVQKGADTTIRSRLNLPHFAYALGRDRSGDNGFELSADAAVLDGFKRIKLEALAFRLYRPSDRQVAIEAAFSGGVEFADAMSGRVEMSKLRFLKQPLREMLPPALARSLDGIPLEKPVSATARVAFRLSGENASAAANARLQAPDFDVNDLSLDADIAHDGTRKRLAVGSLHIGSAERKVSLDARGSIELKRTPFSGSDLAVRVKMDSPEMKRIYGPWELAGKAQLSISVKGDYATGLAAGSMRIERLFVKNDEAGFAVDNVNMDFPFEYYFTPQSEGGSMILVDKSRILENENFRARENFSIGSIRARHPSRDVPFEYVKDISASMFFSRNAFEIVTLKARTLDGSLHGRNILFNLADMDPANMEFRVVMELTNMDVGKLDDPDPRRRSRGAELSLNADISGRGVDIRRELTPRGYVNIHKIGEKFGNRLFKGLSSERGRSKLGIAQLVYDNAVIPRAFNYTLDRGLMYATVTFRKKAIGMIVGPEQTVEFDRMPLQEYLRKVQEVE